MHREPQSDLVSIVIPCFNPVAWLIEAVDSARAQTHPHVEILLVDDGSNLPESQAILEAAGRGADRLLRQENRGPGAARNTAVAAARGAYILPLDSDDRLPTGAVAELLQVLRTYPNAAFAYGDYRVFGEASYVERLPEYNLYHLLERNTLIYSGLFRRRHWELAGGYDESRDLVGCEDWDFWLRLGERGCFGVHVPRLLLNYRRSAASLSVITESHREEAVAAMRRNHPHLYGFEARVSIKTRWAPAVSLAGPGPVVPQTILDIDCAQRAAPAFLIPGPAGVTTPEAAELCALGIRSGSEHSVLEDGSRCVARDKAGTSSPSLQPPRPGKPTSFRWLEILRRHLHNAELDTLSAWTRRPMRSLQRMIPLRLKERVNQAAGRQVFDLSFYLRFQPRSLVCDGAVVTPLEYLVPKPRGRRVALLTPHLGLGGAERVLLEVAAALEGRCELFVIATQSSDSRWRSEWERLGARVYDLAKTVPPERAPAAIVSMASNWRFDTVVLQNSLPAYAALPHLRPLLPGARLVDLIYAVDPVWDFVSSTSAVAPLFDARIASSEAGKQRLETLGVPPAKIHLIRNGIDLRSFPPAPLPLLSNSEIRILFCGRLDPVKRPLLLPRMARALAALRPGGGFRFVVVGDGPERESLAAAVRRDRLEPYFELLGHVPDVPAVLAACDVVVLPSASEGVPLIVLEAFAAARAVVCSAVGAVGEVVDAASGILIPRFGDEPARFAAALHELIGNPQRLAEMGAAGRRRVEIEFDAARAAQAYRELLL